MCKNEFFLSLGTENELHTKLSWFIFEYKLIYYKKKISGQKTNFSKFSTKNKFHTNFKDENNAFNEKLVLVFVELT
jgi:hypothetical protein